MVAVGFVEVEVVEEEAVEEVMGCSWMRRSGVWILGFGMWVVVVLGSLGACVLGWLFEGSGA